MNRCLNLQQKEGEKMKKFFTLMMMLSVVFFVPSQTNAQLFKLGAGGGLTQITGPESYTNKVSEGGFGYSTEWNAGVLAKLDLPVVPITPRGFILYHSFSGSGEPLIELSKGEAVADDGLEYSQTMLSFGLGVQYGFIPVPAGFDPYLALDLMYNSFGDFKTTINGQEAGTSSGESRFGLAFGLGTEVSIIPVINLDILVSYQLYNLVGKEDNEDTISAVTLDAFLMFSFL